MPDQVTAGETPLSPPANVLLPHVRVLRDPAGIILLSETNGRYLVLDGTDREFVRPDRAISETAPTELLSVLHDLGFISVAADQP